MSKELDPWQYRPVTGAELRRLRETLGLGQHDFAKIIRVSGKRTVRRYETSERAVPPNVAILARLAIEFPQVRDRLLRRVQANRPELEEAPLEKPAEPNAPPAERPTPVYSGVQPME